MLPWDNTDRIICADSYLASVPDAEELRNHVIRFIGVIRTATWQFPMAYLSNIELHNWGYMRGLLNRPLDRKNQVLVDFFWMNWNRRYLFFTGG